MQPRPQHGKGGRRPAPGAKPTPNPNAKRPRRPAPPQGPAGGGRPLRTEWSGEVADWYDRLVGDEGSEYHRHVVHPGVLRLLALQPGETVVDVACGQGAL